MKKLILTVVGLLTLLGSVRATTYEESETAAGAKQYMVEFYQRIGKSDNVTVIDCSPFVHREVDGYEYYIAKVFVTIHSTGQQVVMGVVRDVATQYTSAITENALRQLLSIGDRSVLVMPDLDPDS